ncbi:unnamed protein product [Cuscuta europaea]|uniref:Uncharacterized protein n=1 Tax=Cuscuta europaea TaxID=41803 RepID=A0A9P0ZX77_CUSEU|nr:unnamed protein product [Cuscuta europaea]
MNNRAAKERRATTSGDEQRQRQTVASGVEWQRSQDEQRWPAASSEQATASSSGRRRALFRSDGEIEARYSHICNAGGRTCGSGDWWWSVVDLARSTTAEARSAAAAISEADGGKRRPSADEGPVAVDGGPAFCQQQCVFQTSGVFLSNYK